MKDLHGKRIPTQPYRPSVANRNKLANFIVSKKQKARMAGTGRAETSNDEIAEYNKSQQINESAQRCRHHLEDMRYGQDPFSLE